MDFVKLCFGLSCLELYLRIDVGVVYYECIVGLMEIRIYCSTFYGGVMGEMEQHAWRCLFDNRNDASSTQDKYTPTPHISSRHFIKVFTEYFFI